MPLPLKGIERGHIAMPCCPLWNVFEAVTRAYGEESENGTDRQTDGQTDGRIAALLYDPHRTATGS